MIMVDVQVPALDAVYDFTLSEEVQIGVLIEEITEMICQREKMQMPEELEGLNLCDVNKGQILPNKSTLKECGVVTGSRLILV